MTGGRLLLAGIIPGFIMAFNYIAQIVIRIKITPSLAPTYEIAKIPLNEKVRLLFVDLLPLRFIVFLVTGIFVLGMATPTEAAGLGAVGTIVVAGVYRRLNRKVFFHAISGAVTIQAMTLLIIGGSEIFSQLLSYSGITRAVVTFAVSLNLPPLGFLVSMMIIILILGAFRESVPIMMVTIPIFVPVASQLGFDPIWFGVITLICLQIGLTTPPFGMLLFVMKGVAPPGTSMSDLYRSAMPFVLCDFASISLIIILPSLALWLPNYILK